jgi:hypothetical protein
MKLRAYGLYKNHPQRLPQMLYGQGTGINKGMKQVKVEKTAVHDFVANYLFPKLKFVRGAGGNMDDSTEKKIFVHW